MKTFIVTVLFMYCIVRACPQNSICSVFINYDNYCSCPSEAPLTCNDTACSCSGQALVPCQSSTRPTADQTSSMAECIPNCTNSCADDGCGGQCNCEMNLSELPNNKAMHMYIF